MGTEIVSLVRGRIKAGSAEFIGAVAFVIVTAGLGVWFILKARG